MPEDPRSSKSRRRLFWFSVMAVFFLLVVGLLFGMIGVPWLQYRNQLEVITRLEALGGEAEAQADEEAVWRWMCGGGGAVLRATMVATVKFSAMPMTPAPSGEIPMIQFSGMFAANGSMNTPLK